METSNGTSGCAWVIILLLMSWWFGWWLFRNTYIPEVVYYEDEKTAFRTGGEYRS
jgi:di/tricarboxylate transporter